MNSNRCRPLHHGIAIICALAAALSMPAIGAEERARPGAATDVVRELRRADSVQWRTRLRNIPVDARDELGNTALHYAALRDDVAAVAALLARGADARAKNHDGAMPLQYGTGSEGVVRALLDAGAPADVVSKSGVTPLLGAVAHADSFPVAQRLIAAGANVNHRRLHPRGPMAQAGILSIAIVGGDQRTIKLLLDHGASPNVEVGTSPLAAAAFIGDAATVRALLDRGAKIDYRSGFAGTPLNFALHAQQYDVARILIDHGADLSSRSTIGYGTPPIVWSAYNDRGDAAMARLLVARGVDVNTSNDLGETALSYALRRGADTPLVRFLREAGAKAPPLPVRTKSVPSHPLPASPEARAALIRDASQRAVDVLVRNSSAFLDNAFVRNTAKCVTCHQQALPAVAFGLARERGLRVDAREVGRQLDAILQLRTPAAERARQMDEPVTAADVTLGFEADGLHALRYPADDVTDAMSHYLLATQRPDGSWVSQVRRPPIEDGPLVGTAWSARAVQLYPPPGRTAEVETALRRAAAWLAAQPVRSHNEQVFQLLGLAWTNAGREPLARFAKALLATQEADGGWRQLPDWAPDAWATGSALVALQRAGVPVTHAAYQRGLDFLLHTQFADGSWWVRSRSWPFQPHFDGGFPHGKDQWISAAGTAWAAIALLLTMEPGADVAALPDGRALIRQFAAHGPAATAAVAAQSHPAGTADDVHVTFARDIRPIVERSCAGCHLGEKVRGGLSFASRDSLLKGGQSGEPAVVPGHSDTSPLIRFISDQVEDLEMPPLHRREKYPALTSEQVALFRTWIDSGAVWESR